jgi:hypothetical protein
MRPTASRALARYDVGAGSFETRAREGRGTEDLDAVRPPRDLAQPRPVVARSICRRARRLASLAVEALAGPGRLQREDARRLGGHHERVRDAPRRDEEAALANAMLFTLDVNEELASEQVDRLILVRMQVQAASPCHGRAGPRT